MRLNSGPGAPHYSRNEWPSDYHHSENVQQRYAACNRCRYNMFIYQNLAVTENNEKMKNPHAV